MAIPYWTRWYRYSLSYWGKWHLQGERGRTLCGREYPRYQSRDYTGKPDRAADTCQQCLAQLKARMPAND